jgi:hypothetical protein
MRRQWYQMTLCVTFCLPTSCSNPDGRSGSLLQISTSATNFYFFGGIRVRTQDLLLARQALYHLNCTPVLDLCILTIKNIVQTSHRKNYIISASHNMQFYTNSVNHKIYEL